MSQRELNTPGSTQQLRGVNQRQSLVRVPDGFFVNSTGVQFGIEGYNVQRIAGKVLAGKLSTPILGYFIFNGKLIVQTLNEVFITNATELFSLAFTYTPFAPPAPVLSSISYYTLKVTTPATLPFKTVSFSIQRSLDNLTWTTIAAGLGVSVVFNDSGLVDNTLYYYRLLSVNVTASVPGPSVSTTTLDATVTAGGVTVTAGGIVVKGI